MSGRDLHLVLTKWLDIQKYLLVFSYATHPHPVDEDVLLIEGILRHSQYMNTYAGSR